MKCTGERVVRFLVCLQVVRPFPVISTVSRLSLPMHRVEIRSLKEPELPLARDMAAQYPDFHARYVVERLPSFFRIARDLDSDPAYWGRQRLVVGAFFEDDMIGTASVEPVTKQTSPERTEEEDERFWAAFTDHEASVFDTLQQSLCTTIIDAPVGSLSIHSLAVLPAHRKQGTARSLVRFIIDALEETERSSLYIEFARLKWLRQFGCSLGFTIVRQTFSISERLEYGCWGSILMRYQCRDSG